MLSTRFIASVARSNSSISEHLALEHLDLDPAPSAPRPMLLRKPLELNSERTLKVLSTAAGNPYRYDTEEPGRTFCRPHVLTRDITVGDAMISMRDRLTHLTALLQDFNVPMSVRRENGNLCDATLDLIHEATSFFAVVEIALTEDHNRQVKRSIEAN